MEILVAIVIGLWGLLMLLGGYGMGRYHEAEFQARKRLRLSRHNA